MAVYDYAGTPANFPSVWAPPGAFTGRHLEAGDILLFHNGDTITTITTVLCRQEDEAIRRRLWNDTDSSSDVLYYLAAVESVEIDIQNPLISDRYPWLALGRAMRSSNIGRQNDLVKQAYRMVNVAERRRIYRLFGASNLPSPIAMLQYRTSAEGILNWMFEKRVSLASLKSFGLLLLVVGFVIGVFFEAVCVISSVADLVGFSSSTCIHVFGLRLIDPATTFSFSLTAFLLVATTVVVAVVGSTAAPNRIGSLRIKTVDGFPELPNSAQISEGRLTKYTDIGKLDPHHVQWLLHAKSPESIAAYRAEKNELEPTDGKYQIWRVGNEPPASERPVWRFQGDIGWENKDNNLPDWLVSDSNERQSIDWWIVPDQEDAHQELRTALQSSLTYSISASLLGIVLAWYPWDTGSLPNPWLTGLSPWENLSYAVLATLFTFVFLGMVYTSIGIIEILPKLRD
ncbi:hypothetical protein [Halorussus amylolyticus]|uniref:hypothetical protein n=1 Tax=Halorussus amylolyticus TaxID=1126242 RepID=UPI00105379FA|nr:hypothetical protein [Halorussus amylolyticus]